MVAGQSIQGSLFFCAGPVPGKEITTACCPFPHGKARLLAAQPSRVGKTRIEPRLNQGLKEARRANSRIASNQSGCFCVGDSLTMRRPCRVRVIVKRGNGEGEDFPGHIPALLFYAPADRLRRYDDSRQNTSPPASISRLVSPPPIRGRCGRCCRWRRSRWWDRRRRYMDRPLRGRPGGR